MLNGFLNELLITLNKFPNISNEFSALSDELALNIILITSKKYLIVLYEFSIALKELVFILGEFSITLWEMSCDTINYVKREFVNYILSDTI